MHIKVLVAMVLAVVMLPNHALADDHPDDEVLAFVRQYAASEMESSGVPGMVFVMVTPRGSRVEAFGDADPAAGRPMTPETPLRVGSISKPVTAAIALELEARGRIDLDVPVDRYLDIDLTDRHGEASTIRQLLQHRGGYPDAIVGSHHLDPADAVDLDEWVRLIDSRPMPAGVVASYSSVGYTLAGAGIAGATGRSFTEIADEALFGPLGMVDATFDQPVPTDVAVGHALEDGSLRPFPIDAADLVPGAGLTASARDIERFLSGLLSDDGPLRPSTRSALLTPAGPGPGLRAYTTGLAEWRYDERSVLYHAGNGMGTTTRLMVLPDLGVGVFTAVNGEALVGLGDPSPQSMFVGDLHSGIVEQFLPGPGDVGAVPATSDPSPVPAGNFIPTRVDPGSPLRLEGLVSQTSLGDGAMGIRAADGSMYATYGGTSSYRLASWWEGLALNGAVLVASLATMAVGAVVAARRARGTLRFAMLATPAIAATFLTALVTGLLGTDVMDLFTGLSSALVIAQIAAVGVAVSTGAMIAVGLAARRRSPAFSGAVRVSWAAMSLAGAALTTWAWAWSILPV